MAFEVAGDVVAWLCLAAFVAGLIDSIAGGGGLITIPALLLAGAPPVETLATNKLQSCFGSGTAAVTYARAGHVVLRRQVAMACGAALAAAGGAGLTHLVPEGYLRLVLPVILIVIAAFFALRRDLSDMDRAERLRPLAFTLLVVLPVAAYDGFFGPGTGSFLVLGFVLLAGHGVLRATAHAKLLNFASNAGALAVFVLSGNVWWAVGLLMAAGQALGAMLGARLAMRSGARLIRPLLVATCLAMALRLIWQGWQG